MTMTCYAKGGACTDKCMPCEVCGFGVTLEEMFALALAHWVRVEKERDAAMAELERYRSDAPKRIAALMVERARLAGMVRELAEALRERLIVGPMDDGNRALLTRADAIVEE